MVKGRDNSVLSFTLNSLVPTPPFCTLTVWQTTLRKSLPFTRCTLAGTDSLHNLHAQRLQAGIRSPDGPTRSKSLYRLRYPGYTISLVFIINILPIHSPFHLCPVLANYRCLRAFTTKLVHVTFICSTFAAYQAHRDVLRVLKIAR